MLKSWQSHAEFQRSLAANVRRLWSSPQHRQRLLYHVQALAKVWLLNLDPLEEVLLPRQGPAGSGSGADLAFLGAHAPLPRD